MAKREADPRQGLLFESEAVVSRQTTAPGSETGTKRKAPRAKTPAELIGTTSWRAYSGKTRVQCSDCVVEAKASWDAKEPLKRSIGAARWIEITYVEDHTWKLASSTFLDAGTGRGARTDGGVSQLHTYLCTEHADARGHSNAKARTKGGRP